MSSIQPGVPDLGPSQPLSDQAPIDGQPQQGVIFLDGLSPAEQKALLEKIFESQSPSLAPPTQFAIDSSNPASAAIGIGSVGDAEETKHEIIMTMLDQWINNVAEMARESKKHDLERQIEGIDIAFHTYQGQVNRAPDANFPIFSVGLVLGTIGVHEAMNAIPPVVDVGLNPVAQLAHTVPFAIAPRAAELGVIGSLMIFGYGLQYATSALFARKVENGEEPDPRDVAKAYGDNVLATIGNTDFNNFLTGIITQNVKQTGPLDPERQMDVAQSMAKVKLVLLSSALQSLYQAELGGMSGKEFAAMVRDKNDGTGKEVIELPDGDPKKNFVYLIRGYLSLIEDNQRANLMEALEKYFDTHPSNTTLTDPAKVLAGVYAHHPKGELPI